MEKEKVILGVDPGTNILGYGIIKVSGKKVEVLTLDVIMLNKIPDHAVKLKAIFEKVSNLIEQYLPDEMAVEAPFFGKNVQSMLKLGRAQGVIMAAGLNRGIPIQEYSPRKIKQSITGKGGASKEQVAGMLESILNTKIEHRYMDATDGLAVALCHHYQLSSPLGGSGKSKSWDQFIKNNPGRISGS
ncbi:MAG TPA: crossover junction endodeoxyribonuclease RuvC [Cryomorphaceae bacterium]|mgnify:CR=1 FL=1|nr:crossover junction endodeoxyribonuclease RuvC [Owenweeksia sp.]MBF98497.1 crossover junction endodeoxyribonuclease RuvC [Owenweeksia sp.]HAD96597.1 crossover junction endodeoxyribonuclease RuvC [Cryomorphaceae bacterium]HBF19187.1 crossover junction endodeoxyribonuclease RuvC [Cryomorphaceae bacterium]HCQ14842.1 crossover junction endodeoxyribonuclease RuvC [Cryomorphaceae bacterium]|tara:strand:+ start:10808 stop:11368 length:561 start_codon:yes stop_codon:yes gene_type:complete